MKPASDSPSSPAPRAMPAPTAPTLDSASLAGVPRSNYEGDRVRIEEQARRGQRLYEATGCGEHILYSCSDRYVRRGSFTSYGCRIVSSKDLIPRRI